MERGLPFKPKILGFLCNWCAYGGADLCGVSRYQYPPCLRVVRVMCSGRVDLEFIFRAFREGMDGVFIGGCWPGECHYLTAGNYGALGTVHLAKKLLQHAGIAPDRLLLAWVSASQGVRFAELMHEFSKKVKALGPLGKGEGIKAGKLEIKLEAVLRLVPYIKLVERERLRLTAKPEEAYHEFFTSAEADRLFAELITSKLAASEVLLLLQKGPLSGEELSRLLDLDGARLQGLIRPLVRDGLVRYDWEQNQFAL